MSTKEHIQPVHRITPEKEKEYKVILYNDDVHTFDYVIETLIEVCKHSLIQAEQCTLLVHHKGKASVQHGTYKNMKKICTGLIERGLTAKINS